MAKKVSKLQPHSTEVRLNQDEYMEIYNRLDKNLRTVHAQTIKCGTGSHLGRVGIDFVGIPHEGRVLCRQTITYTVPDVADEVVADTQYWITVFEKPVTKRHKT